MRKFMKKKNVKTNTSYEKYQLRGAIKEIMKNYGLRTISLANYNKWLGNTTVEGVHSVRYDIMNGYIHMHEFNSNGKVGMPYDSVGVDVYQKVYDTILNILKTENEIPSKVKRNILVKVNR